MNEIKGPERANYRVEFVRSARKELEKLDAAIVETIFARISALVIDPRPAGCRKLKGPEPLWRIRCGDYRVVYLIDDSIRVVEIQRVRHRKNSYK